MEIKGEREKEGGRGLPRDIIRCDRERSFWHSQRSEKFATIPHCLTCSVFQSLSPRFTFPRDSLTFLNVVQYLLNLLRVGLYSKSIDWFFVQSMRTASLHVCMNSARMSRLHSVMAFNPLLRTSFISMQKACFTSKYQFIINSSNHECMCVFLEN